MQISGLPASSTFGAADVLAIEINGVTYKITGATLAAALQSIGDYVTAQDIVNNLTTTDEGYVLDARQGKALLDAIEALGAADVGAVAADQGAANAGKALVVGNDGNVTTGKTVRPDAAQTLTAAEQAQARGNIGAASATELAAEAAAREAADSDLKSAFIQLSTSDFARGVWENGAITTWDKRICTSKAYNIKAGDKFVYSTGTLEIAFGIINPSSLTTNNQYISWHTVESETTFTFEYDGNLFVQFKKADDSAVTVNEYDATCKIYTGMCYDAENANKKISDIIGLDALDVTWYQGGISAAGNTTDSARIRTDFIQMPDTIVIASKSGYSATFIQYDEHYHGLIGGTWTANNYIIHRHENAKFIKVAASKGVGSSSSITPSDGVNVNLFRKFEDIGSIILNAASKSDYDNIIGLNSQKFTWEQGGLSGTGETVDNARIRTVGLSPMPNSIYIAPAYGYRALIYVYDADLNIAKAGSWQTDPFVTDKETGMQWFRVVLAKSSNASIPITDGTNVDVCYSYSNLGNDVIKLKQAVFPAVQHSYIGMPVSQKHGYNSQKIMSITYSTGTLNSIAVNDNYIVAYINEANLLRVYNRATKALEHELVIDLGHANNMCMGNKYDSSDPLPLLYVEKEDSDGTYYVVRVSSNWSASIIKTYTFPEETFGYHPQVTWNFDDGVCYSLGAKIVDGVQKSLIFVRANLNDETQNSNNTYTPVEFFSCGTQNMAYVQDSKYYNGIIYLAHSSATDSTAISHIFMIDTSCGNIISKIPAPFTGEIEGLALYDDNGTVKMCVTNYFNFYEMVFY